MICCAEIRVDERIRQIASVKHDSEILFITSDELVAKEAKNIIPHVIRIIHVLRNNYQEITTL